MHSARGGSAWPNLPRQIYMTVERQPPNPQTHTGLLNWQPDPEAALAARVDIQFLLLVDREGTCCLWRAGGRFFFGTVLALAPPALSELRGDSWSTRRT